VISVDTKKKELAGEFKNAGRDWRPQGEPVAARTHHIPEDSLGKACHTNSDRRRMSLEVAVPAVSIAACRSS